MAEGGEDGSKAHGEPAEPLEVNASAFFRQLADSSPDWEYCFDPHGQVVYCSPACLPITGYRADEIEREPALLARMLYPGDATRCCEGGAGDVAAVPGACEFRLVTRAGDVRWVEHRCAPVLDERGRAIGRRVSHRDITQRRRKEELLRLQAAALDQISDRVAITDLSGNVTYVNSAICRMLGRPLEAMLGESVEMFAHGDPGAAVRERESLAATLRDGFHQRQIVALMPDGKQVNTSLRTFLVRGEDGVPVGVCGVGVDTTELEGARQALAASEATLRAVFACMHDVVLVLDREGRYLNLVPVNPALLFRPMEELEGRTLHELMPCELADPLHRAICRALDGRQTEHIEYAMEIRGKKRWFSAAISPLGDDRVVVVARDVSESRRAAEELREREAKYRAAIETSPDGFLVLDMDGRILEVNDAYVLRSGYSREQLLKMRIAELKAPGVRRDVTDRRERIQLVGQDVFESEHCTASGEVWQVEVSVSYWPIGGGRLFVFARDLLHRTRSDALLRARLRLAEMADAADAGVLVNAVVHEAMVATHSRRGSFRYAGAPAVAGSGEQELSAPAVQDGVLRAVLSVSGKVAEYTQTDAEVLAALAPLMFEVLERRKTQQALRESEERYRGVVSATSDGIILRDVSGRIRAFNATAERVFGLTAEEAMHHSSISRDWGTVHEDGSLWPGEEHPSLHTLRTGEPCRDRVMGVRQPGGEIVWISVNTTPIRSGPGGALSGVVVTFSDITARKRMEDELRRSLARNQALLREVHHRVKNNLAAVAGLVEMQRFRVHDEESSHELEELQGRLRSIALVHEKLYNADNVADIEFECYLRALLGYLRTSTAFPGILEMVARSGAVLSLDEAVPCGMIVNELVTNSLRHAFPGGKARDGGPCRIEVSLSVEPDGHRLSVFDNGVGLPEGVEAGTARSLGLRLVRMLAEHQLGGEISVERDGGTRVSIRFRKDGRR